MTRKIILLMDGMLVRCRQPLILSSSSEAGPLGDEEGNSLDVMSGSPWWSKEL